MLHIISPKGKLMQIDTAVPVCERLVRFNGRRRLLQERAQNPKTANAIVLNVTQEKNSPFNTSEELYVGNLPDGKAEEILRFLLTQGYFDFMGEFTYQKVKNISEVAFDQGKSQPYTTEGIMGSFMGGLFCPGNLVSMPLQATDIDNHFGIGCIPVSAPVSEDVDFDMWAEEGLEEEEGLDE